MEPKIIVSHSRKGGVGKSTLAYELAWLFEAPLVDLDWEGGGVSKTWGYRYQDHAEGAIPAALRRGSPPRLLSGRPTKRPDLVPGHPDFKDAQPAADEMADALAKWAGDWGTDWLVVDTHPGSTEATDGALSVASAVVVPVPLATKEIDGTEATIEELEGYPVILVPNLVPKSPPMAMLRRLNRIVEGTTVQVAPPVPDGRRAVSARTRRTAMAANPTKNLAEVIAAIEQVATFVREYVKETSDE